MRRRVSCEQQLDTSQSVLRGVAKAIETGWFAYVISSRDEKESHAVPRKGIRLIFLNLDTERDVSASRAVTQTSSQTSAKALGRVVFSL